MQHQWRVVQNNGSPSGRPLIADLTSPHLSKPVILTYICDIPEVHIVDLGDLTYKPCAPAAKIRISTISCANHFAFFPGVIKATVLRWVSSMAEGWFSVDGVSSRFCAGFPAGHPQNTRTTYAFSQSEGTPLIQTNEINVGHLVAHCSIPTFCVPQVDLDSTGPTKLLHHLHFWAN